MLLMDLEYDSRRKDLQKGMSTRPEQSWGLAVTTVLDIPRRHGIGSMGDNKGKKTIQKFSLCTGLLLEWKRGNAPKERINKSRKTDT